MVVCRTGQQPRPGSDHQPVAVTFLIKQQKINLLLFSWSLFIQQTEDMESYNI